MLKIERKRVVKKGKPYAIVLYRRGPDSMAYVSPDPAIITKPVDPSNIKILMASLSTVTIIILAVVR